MLQADHDTFKFLTKKLRVKAREYALEKYHDKLNLGELGTVGRKGLVVPSELDAK